MVPKLAPVRLAQALLLQIGSVTESMLLEFLVCPVSKVVEAELQRKRQILLNTGPMCSSKQGMLRLTQKLFPSSLKLWINSTLSSQMANR